MNALKKIIVKAGEMQIANVFNVTRRILFRSYLYSVVLHATAVATLIPLLHKI